MNDIILALLKFAYWILERFPRRIRARLQPTFDSWSFRYASYLTRQLRRNIARIRADVVRQRDATRMLKDSHRSHRDPD